jgi:hypothetical protein
MVKKKMVIPAVILLMVALGAWNGHASASHFTGPCADQLNAVESAIQAGVFVGKSASTDQTNLLAKLEGAAAKIQLQKFPDAVDKLLNISDTATALATAPKPKLEDASAINTAVVTAVTCAGAL